ncbi:alpha/beta hydrolase [Pleurocapsales cyanobacterium LEGE 10410]|nr:alpha/beta hydrolase [Pleurocapsales cyanobacterium LEGE 10410]
MGETKIYRWFRDGIVMAIAGVAICFSPNRVLAAEKIIFTYGATTQSISLTELQTFVETGETASSVESLLSHSQQHPFVMRWILQQEFPAETVMISDLLNTIPGEYVLSQTGRVVGSESERANVQALRGALIASTSDNNLVSLIELLENYPTKQVYIDGKILSKLRVGLSQLVEETNQYIKPPANFPSN